MRYASTVIKGFGRGKTLGFPTFNLVIPNGFDFEFGIYAAWVWIDGEKYQGAMHYGPIPTFDLEKPSLEIFLLNYSKNEPVAQLEFEIVEFIRGIIKFSQPTELQNRIKEDIDEVRTILKQ